MQTSRSWLAFSTPGTFIPSDGCLRSNSGAIYKKTHVEINDATRQAYFEVLSEDKQAKTVGFLLRAVAWFDIEGISCSVCSLITAEPTDPSHCERHDALSA